MRGRPSIFLSHTSLDKPFVRELARDLQANGICVWLDEAEINVGDSLIEKISDGISNVEYLGIVLSPRSVDSAWVKKELNIALTEEIGGRRLKVLPILLESCQIPAFLKDKFYADFTGRKPRSDALSLLLRAMGLSPLGSSATTNATPLTLERLRTFLADYFGNSNPGDWNDIGFLLEQLDEIEIRDSVALRALLERARPGLERYGGRLLTRSLGGIAPTGTVRMAMWMVSPKAAATCPAGRATFRKYNKFVQGALQQRHAADGAPRRS